VDEIVEFVLGSCILNVVNDGVQHVDAEGTWSQLLVEGRIDDPLKNGDDSPKFVAVGDDLGNGSVDAEVKASLNLELGDFIANVLNHPVELVEMLLMDVNNVGQKISFVFLSLNGGFQLRDLDRVVGGQRQRRRCYGERSNVPLTSLAFGHMRKTCQEILEKVEDLFEVGFVKFKGAVECSPVVFVEVEIKTIKVWNAAIHTLGHLVL
jgi:hypothetical protein